ncbi:carboxylesterase/lipase family protein [Sphingomonas ginsenosidivorax]|uniref:Carboxylic ester hydrolase n=1 Tax=Sphingomonas ginsenosidivorax TaxID=862135 RepID=A0A5C6UF38_9SPHN|nr:carboxylesterase family protein [Sphingomonas ginsenosidivorax]TXC71084.1 carboxylesterase/lipase family protein [Sphingomonas ginsenosidivorax]
MDDTGPATRRTFLSGAAVLLALPAFSVARAAAADGTVVETADGKLRGAARDGVVSFKGVPYAADTSGRNRFMAPRPVAKWAGVRDALAFGDRCPQARRAGGREIVAPPVPPQGEDCCVLNVYTPGAGRDAARPVMVYIHGGGFQGGSGDGATLDGTALARGGDVVVVTLNHRLNVFGYANLGGLDPDFVDAGNAGQLDLIAALQWVQTNIAAFGGDPHRVTVFGESGGGAKIVALSVMPAADPLFRNSINMSGSGAFFLRPSQELRDPTDELLRVLGLGKGDLRRLQAVPVARLYAANVTALANLKADQLRPVVDGRNIIHAPQSAAGWAMQAAKPGIMSCTATEATPWLLRDRTNLAVTERELATRIQAQFGIDEARAQDVIAAYRQDGPKRSAWDVLVDVASDALMRAPMRKATEARAATGKQPVYLAGFDWRSPVENGIWGGPHAIDVPFAFGTLDKDRLTAGGGARAAAASRNLLAAYVAFATSGTPQNPNMPAWPAYDLARRPSMLIDETCRVVNDLHAARRQIGETLAPQSTFDVTNGPLVHPAA